MKRLVAAADGEGAVAEETGEDRREGRGASFRVAAEGIAKLNLGEEVEEEGG